jgi:hypothetical protein
MRARWWERDGEQVDVRRAAALGSSAAPVRVDELSEKQSSHDFATSRQKIGALSRLSVVGGMQRECGSATVTVDGGWTAQ